MTFDGKLLGVIAGTRWQAYSSVTDLAATGAGADSSAGTLVTGLSASGVYQVTLPASQTYTGYSAWDADDASGPGTPPPAGQYWGNRAVLTGGPGAAVGSGHARSTVIGTPTGYPDGPTARAAFPGGTVTGYSEYKLWIDDSNPADNRGGLSVKLERIA